MAQPATEGGQILSPGEMVSGGFAPGPPGPFSNPATPETNAQAIREKINPQPQPEQTLLGKAGQWVSGKLQKQAESHPMERRALSLAMPGGLITGPIGQGLLEGGLRLAEGKGAESAGLGAGAAGLGSVAGGLAGKGLGYGLRILKGPAAARGYEAAVAGREAQIASEKTLANETAANRLMDYLRTKVPVFEKMGKGSEGLDEVTSTGAWNKLHQWYDQYMKDVAKQAAGKTIRLGAEEAKSLGLTSAGVPQFAPPSGVQRFGPAGPMPQGQPDLNSVTVDAGQAAEKALGLWKKNPRLYRTIVNQLDAQGIGDEATRAGYRTAVAAREWLKKNNIIKTGEFDLTKAQQVQRGTGSAPLDKRASGAGEDIEGIVKSVKTLPAPPIPIPPPTVPIGHPFALGGGAAELGAMALGHHGYGLPYVAGGLLGTALLPKALTLGSPSPYLGPILQELLSRGGAAAGGYATESTQ